MEGRTEEGGVQAAPHLTQGLEQAVPLRARRWAVEARLVVEVRLVAETGVGGVLAAPRLTQGLELAVPLRARFRVAVVRVGIPGVRLGGGEARMVHRGARETLATEAAGDNSRRS